MYDRRCHGGCLPRRSRGRPRWKRSGIGKPSTGANCNRPLPATDRLITSSKPATNQVRGRDALALHTWPRRLFAVLHVRLGDVLVAEDVPRLVEARPLEMANARVAPGLLYGVGSEDVDRLREVADAVHAVPARVERQAAVAQQRVQRVLVAPHDAFAVRSRPLEQLPRAVIAAH